MRVLDLDVCALQGKGPTIDIGIDIDIDNIGRPYTLLDCNSEIAAHVWGFSPIKAFVYISTAVSNRKFILEKRLVFLSRVLDTQHSIHGF